METNNNKEEDILNSLLKTNYIDLSNVETNNGVAEEILLKYRYREEW